MGRKTLKKIKFFILDLLSFDSVQARLINLSLILLLSLTLTYDKVKYIPVRSIYSLLGIKAYSIGMTRALSSLMHLDIKQALEFNKLIIIVFLVIMTLWIINLVKCIKYYKKTGKIYSFRK